MDLFERLWYILTRASFVLFMASVTCLFVTVTGVHFWITDYFTQVLSVEPGAAYRLYLVSALGGPATGILCCALLFDRIGGYTSEYALPVCLSVGCAGMVFALASVIVRDNPTTCAVLISLEFFCGAFIKPAIAGLMLN